MKIVWPKCPGLVIRGRHFTNKELVLIRKLIRDNPSWGRTKLSERVCEILDWYQDNGRLKDRGCRVALLKLESLGYIKLPKRIIERGGKPPRVLSEKIQITKSTQMPTSLILKPVSDRTSSTLWNSLIDQYHYLGLATPVGKMIRYLIYGDDILLGAISFSEPAWNIEPRDKILIGSGISTSEIRNLVIANNRYLILPTVTIPNLASRILGLAQRMVLRDWQDKFSCKPGFAETFIDPTFYTGTCYSAANWVQIGKTKGFSKRGNTHSNQNKPKLIFMRGFDSKAQKILNLSSLKENQRVA